MKKAGEAVSLDGVRKLFDGVMKHYDVTTEYLAPRASIVHSPNLESAVVRVLAGKENRLTRDEAAVLKRFERRDNDFDETPAVSFADECLRRPSEKSLYIDLRWIPATSNEVERLFSTAGRVSSPERQSMLPTRLETLLFLEYNKRLWDAPAVSTVIYRIEARKRKRREEVLEL